MNLADSMDSERGLAAEMRERVAARETRAALSRPSPTYAPPDGGGASPTFGDLSREAAYPRGGQKASEDVYKMIFKGDITTGEGMIRLTERLMREFAAGKLPHRRFEAMLRAVRLIATMRRKFPAPPVDGPQESADEPAAASHAGGGIPCRRFFSQTAPVGRVRFRSRGFERSERSAKDSRCSGRWQGSKGGAGGSRSQER